MEWVFAEKGNCLFVNELADGGNDFLIWLGCLCTGKYGWWHSL